MTVRNTYRKELNLDLINSQVLEASKKYPDAISAFEKLKAGMNQGINLIGQKKYEDAVNLLELVANGFEKLGVFELEKVCLSYIANVAYTITFNRALAIKSFSKIVEISTDPQELVSTNNCLATFYLTSNDGRRALDYCEKAMKYIEKIKDENSRKESCGCTIFNMGDAYFRLKDYKKAEDFFSQAIKIFKEIKDREKEAKCLSGFGRIYLNTNRLDKSVEYFNNALKIFENFNNKEEIAETFKSLAIAYVGSNQTDKSIELLRKAAVIHRQLGLIDSATDDLGCAAIIEQFSTLANKSRQKGNGKKY
jgi:tetratricopeptide (TPR) repeat protein